MKRLEFKRPNYSPLHDRLLISELPEEEITKGGIIIPDSVKEKPQKGVVVAVGAGLDRTLTVQPGDLVNYSKYAGSELEIDFVKYRIMRETDVFGAFTKPDFEIVLIGDTGYAVEELEGDNADVVTTKTRMDAAIDALPPVVVSPESFMQNQQAKTKKK